MKKNINDLIILGNLIDGFDEFNEDFHKLMEMNDRLPVVVKLCKIVYLKKDEMKFWDSKATKEMKEFYRKHKLEIDVINRYSKFGYFLNNNYDFQGNMTNGHNSDNNLSFFYDYFLNHKKELSQILLLLEKMNKLGITTLEFNEAEDFENNEYEAYTNFDSNVCFNYLENMNIISYYNEYKVKYKSLVSNYKIVMDPFKANRLFDHSVRKIVVNNLLFDPERLPENLSEEVVFKEIRKFLNEEGEKWAKVRGDIEKSVNLSIAADDLVDGFNSANKAVQELDNIYEKEKLLAILHKIKEGLEELETTSEEYSDSICDDLITEDEIESAKCKRLEIRNHHYFH